MKIASSLSVAAACLPLASGFSTRVAPHLFRQSPASSNLSVLHAASRGDQDTALSAVMVDLVENSIITDEQKTTTPTPSTTATSKTYLDDGFVFGLEGSGLERPKGKIAKIVVEGDSLETQHYQVALVSATFLGHAAFASTAFAELLDRNSGDIRLTSAQALVLIITSWLLADFGSGVLHWSVDNYGNGKTPVMGSIIAAFQGHHTAPWTITERGFCNNVYKLCIPFGIAPMAVISAITGPMVTLFMTSFCVTEILSQEFHKWSHMTKSQCPTWVNAMQNAGITIGRKPHALHHMAPYEGNYCIISGIWNKPLDESGVFRWMEHMIYQWNGVESNAWKLDPELRKRTLRGEYRMPESTTPATTTSSP